MEEDNKKPYKIKDITRVIKKAVVAGTLDEVRAKAAEKFGRTELPNIHLDSDGTEVDDEDYFQTLEPNAELIVVFPGEQWIDQTPVDASIVVQIHGSPKAPEHPNADEQLQRRVFNPSELKPQEPSTSPSPQKSTAKEDVCGNAPNTDNGVNVNQRSKEKTQKQSNRNRITEDSFEADN